MVPVFRRTVTIVRHANAEHKHRPKSVYKDEHNHEPDVIETAVRQARSNINLRSTFSRITKRIITEVVNDYPNEALHRLQSSNYMTQ